MMKRFVLGMAAAIGCALLTASHARGADEPAARQEVPLNEQSILFVTPSVAADIALIRANSVDILECEPRIGRPLMVQATPAHADALRAANLNVTVFHKNVEEYMDQLWQRTQQERMLRADDWYQAYRTFDEFNARLDGIASNRPDLVTPIIIGTSLEGRPLRGVRVTAPDAPGNPRSSRPILFLIGGQHAREWVGPATTLYAVDQLVTEYDPSSRVRSLLERVEIISVPIINPDGYVHTWASSTNRFWRKNRRVVTPDLSPQGVDPNRNWGYQWGLDSGSSPNATSETYRGNHAFSEPETAAIREFVFANPNIRCAVDIHTASQDMMGPWGFQAALSPDHTTFMSLLTLWRTAVQAVYGTPFDIGAISTSLYLVSGGSVDWWYGARGVLGITVELRVGGGFAPPASTIRPNCEEQYQGILALGESIVTPIRISLESTHEAWIPVNTPTPVAFRVLRDAQRPDPSSVRLIARIDDGVPQEVPLSANGDNYAANLPGISCGSTILFHIEARTTNGDLVRHPPVRGIELKAANLVDTARFTGEAGEPWEVVTTGTTFGPWERGVPQATSAQVGADSDDPGDNGFFTGLAAGADANSNDVDAGTTSLYSPTFSLLPPSGMRSLDSKLSYWRTVSTADTNDRLAVSLTTPFSLTVPLESLRATTSPGRLTVANTFPPRNDWRLFFTINDSLPDHTVEAGVDDVRVTMRLCRRSADMNNDQGVTIDDLLLFLQNFELGNIAADYSNDLAVTIDDLLIYLVTFEDGV